MIGIICGTRPEIIKLSPIIERLGKEKKEFVVLFTNQHFSDNMSKKFFKEFLIEGCVHMNEKNENILHYLNTYINVYKCDKIIVQGDTRSAYYGALSAKLNNCKLYHVEAGLRTGDFNSPNPEEFYRSEISNISDVDFCPHINNTTILENLRISNKKIIVTGNPIVQAIRKQNIIPNKKQQVVVTIHRNENKKYIKEIVYFLKQMIEHYNTYIFKIIIHPNRILGDALQYYVKRNVKKIQPLGYKEMLQEISDSAFVITDSGGLQEECCEFGTFCFVMRDKTERKEIIDLGYGILLDPSKPHTVYGFKDLKDCKNPYYRENCIDKIYKELK